MIGVYDSGLGGLTVLAALRRAGIDDEVIYFADQAHVPYGERTDPELHALLSENLAWLEAYGVDLVAMGCNTSCAVAARLGWPPTAFRFPIQDLILNGALAFGDAPFRRVAVIATPATVRSGAYTRAIAAVNPAVDVIERAAPALVPIVEAGLCDAPAARAAVDEIARDLPPGIEAIVYGCTHYPLLDAHFARALPGVTRIDPATEQARAVFRLRPPAGRPAQTRYVTNGEVEFFERNVRRWTGDARGRVSGLETLAR